MERVRCCNALIMDQPPDSYVISLLTESHFAADLFHHAASLCLAEERVLVLVTDINFQAISLKVTHEVIAATDDGGVLNFERVVASNQVSYVLPNVFFVPVFGLNVTFLNDEKKIKRQIHTILSLEQCVLARTLFVSST